MPSLAVRGMNRNGRSRKRCTVVSSVCLKVVDVALPPSPAASFQMEGANLYDVFQKISKGDYKRLPADTFSAPLRSLVERMLSVDPSQRPELEEVWVITQKVIQQTQVCQCNRG